MPHRPHGGVEVDRLVGEAAPFVDQQDARPRPLPGSSFALDHLAIVETKGASRPGDADRLLWALGRRPLKISKYGTGMALLQPDLPANKWAPALRRIRAGADTSIDA